MGRGLGLRNNTKTILNSESRLNSESLLFYYQSSCFNLYVSTDTEKADCQMKNERLYSSPALLNANISYYNFSKVSYKPVGSGGPK